MADPDLVARDYMALWNDPDAGSRSQRLWHGWTRDARYIDPIMEAEGRDGIAAMITAARAQFPDHVFKMHGTTSGHGSFVRFSWTLSLDHGVPIAIGTDIVRLSPDSRVTEVIGFLEKDVA